jgi:hypothetical protein
VPQANTTPRAAKLIIRFIDVFLPAFLP